MFYTLLLYFQTDWVLTFQDEYENNFDRDRVAEWRFWCIIVITFITCGKFEFLLIKDYILNINHFRSIYCISHFNYMAWPINKSWRNKY